MTGLARVSVPTKTEECLDVGHSLAIQSGGDHRPDFWWRAKWCIHIVQLPYKARHDERLCESSRQLLCKILGNRINFSSLNPKSNAQASSPLLTITGFPVVSGPSDQPSDMCISYTGAILHLSGKVMCAEKVLYWGDKPQICNWASSNSDMAPFPYIRSNGKVICAIFHIVTCNMTYFSGHQNMGSVGRAESTQHVRSGLQRAIRRQVSLW